jgi:EAL domain-containing protein (putative c-di-GMP-specific phosphodiesterase class I)
VGVAVAEDGLSAGDIMRCADIAMYSAKALGKNRVEQFNTEHHGSIARHRTLDEHFAEAIPRGEVTLRYQPMIDLRDGVCCGMEAAAYWQHPTLGLIAPADVLAVAERTGQIAALGTHVLETACRQAVQWSEQTQAAADLRVSVDVRCRQLANPEFSSILRQILTESALPPDRLVLELAESEYADDLAAHGQLQKSAAMGVRIALDDFGAGYSSLASLGSHPIFQIKLDRSLVDNGDLAVLQLVVSVGDLLGAQTVAQGLAGDIAIEEVRRVGVNLGQGPAMGTALTAGEVVGWLSSRKMACDPATSAVSQ